MARVGSLCEFALLFVTLEIVRRLIERLMFHVRLGDLYGCHLLR